MGCGNLARVLFFIHVYAWWGVASTAAGQTPVVTVTSDNLMLPSDGDQGHSIYLREADEKYVYVQRKIWVTSWEYKIDVRI